MGSRSNRKARQQLLKGQVIREQVLRQASIATSAEVKLPDDERTIIKKVPAKVGDEIVGDALLFDDGTTDIVLHPNISSEAKAKMRDTVYAFNKETGGTFTIKEVLGEEL